MDIRFAQPDDIEEIAALWCEAFPGKRTIADRVRMLEAGGRFGGLETVLVSRDRDGRLAGAAKIYRMTQHLAARPLPMMGLAAVAVAPHARRRGRGAALCIAALHEARARGDVLSTLYPFRPDYYERLGWGLVGSLLRYRFRTDHLPEYDEARFVRPARLPGDMEAIAECYDRVARRSNGPIARDRSIWAYRLAAADLGVRPIDQKRVLDGGSSVNRRVLVFADGTTDRSRHGAERITGYALVRHAPSRSPGDGALHIREIVTETEDAYRGLMGHVAAHRDQWPLGLHFARLEERFGDRLIDPRPPRHTPSRSLYFPTARVVRGPMLRVLDVGAALRARPLYPSHGSEGPALHVRIRDDQLPENSRIWRVRPAANELANEVVEVTESDRPGEATLETIPATFARILAGELRPSDAGRIGRARVSGSAELLDAAFAAAERFWLLDEF